MRHAAAGIAVLVAVIAAGCRPAAEPPRPVPAGVDASFLVRYATLVSLGADVAALGARSGDPAVRQLARTVAGRRRALRSEVAVLGRGRGVVVQDVADLGVSREDGADDLLPAQIRRTRPFTPAYLVALRRHAWGLARLADVAVRRAADPEVRAFAARVRALHGEELGRVDRLLDALGGVSTPRSRATTG